jgi:hypothetical protein
VATQDPYDRDKHEDRSIWSSKFDQPKDKMRERMASGSPIPHVKKTRTQAVLTSLPVLMLIIGLAFHWFGENRQQQGVPIESEHQWLEGTFDRFTPRDNKATGKHYLWLATGERTRPLRISYEQKKMLLTANYEKGDAIEVKAAPTVEGSSTLWVIEVLTRQ